MRNIIKFPINKTRPSDDMDQSMKFEINAVIKELKKLNPQTLAQLIPKQIEEAGGFPHLAKKDES